MGLSPRVRGNPRRQGHQVLLVGGLSPRVRGNLGHHDDRRQPPVGSIPACTGEPDRVPWYLATALEGSIPACTGEPRAGPVSRRGCAPGLSPRVRGNPVLKPVGRGRGSIPACTGEPCGRSARDPQLGSYPRCTGEPRRRDCHAVGSRVYPRVYGGTIIPRSEGGVEHGVYPRVYGGTALGGAVAPISGRSIPACTGEPFNKMAGTALSGTP